MRPVLISGPLVSRAMPIGLYWMLPGSKLSHASRTFLMVSAWYYRREEKCNTNISGQCSKRHTDLNSNGLPVNLLQLEMKRNHILADGGGWYYSIIGHTGQ